jgi:hypothetical protein
VKISSSESQRAADKFTFPHLTMNSAIAAFHSNSPSPVISSSPTSSRTTYTALSSHLTPSPSGPVTRDTSPCTTVRRHLKDHRGRCCRSCPCLFFIHIELPQGPKGLTEPGWRHLVAILRRNLPHHRRRYRAPSGRAHSTSSPSTCCSCGTQPPPPCPASSPAPPRGLATGPVPPGPLVSRR